MTSDVKAVSSMYKFDFIEINKCLGFIFISTVALFAKYLSFHKHAFGFSFSKTILYFLVYTPRGQTIRICFLARRL